MAETMTADSERLPHAEGLLYTSVETLIGLSDAARNISLKRQRIRSRSDDQYTSRFKGRGMEYDESRPYDVNDDTRHLDWRLMARTGEPYTKLYCEERERAVYLVVDYRETMFFATQGSFKSVVATRLAAMLAWSAVHGGDRIGGVLFNNTEHREVRPQRSQSGVLHFLHALAHFSQQQPESAYQEHTDKHTLSRAVPLVRPGSLVFFISDFRTIQDQEVPMRALAAHSELILLQVYDQLEKTLPPPGEYAVSDGSSLVRFSSRDSKYAERYTERFTERVVRLKALARKLGAGWLSCTTQQDERIVLQNNFGVR